MRAPGSRPHQPRDNLPPRCHRSEDAADPGSSSKSQPVSPLLRDPEEDPKAAKTRAPLKQPRRKQRPLEKNGQEADLGNGHNKSFRRSLLRRLKRHPRKSPQRRIRGRRHSISTSASVGSFEGRRHCSDQLFLTATVFLLPAGWGGGGAGRGAGPGWAKSHNLEKDYINHFVIPSQSQV